jgi:sugar (pentulose or hexulose) kinase
VTVLPWLDGARAPWWQDGARGAVLGLSSAHDAGDLARAAFEAVAYDVRRCLVAMEPATGPATGLALGGAGTGVPVWSSVLTAVTGLPARGRQSGEAASAGAALLAAWATGDPRRLDDLDPPAKEIEPDPGAVAFYRDQWERAERIATAVLELEVDATPAARSGAW